MQCVHTAGGKPDDESDPLYGYAVCARCSSFFGRKQNASNHRKHLQSKGCGGDARVAEKISHASQQLEEGTILAAFQGGMEENVRRDLVLLVQALQGLDSPDLVTEEILAQFMRERMFPNDVVAWNQSAPAQQLTSAKMIELARQQGLLTHASTWGSTQYECAWHIDKDVGNGAHCDRIRVDLPITAAVKRAPFCNCRGSSSRKSVPRTSTKENKN
jgi:hypothetical protein